MKTRLLLSLLFLFNAFNIVAEEDKKLYKWTDKQGNVHFSDQPEKGAEEIEMKLAPVTSMIKAPIKTEPKSIIPSQKLTEYTSLGFSNLSDGAVIRNNAQTVDLVASVEPALHESHSIRFFLDGAIVPNENGSTSVTAEAVENGKHSASFIIVDANGKQLQASETVHFQLLKRINPKIKQQQSGQN